MTTFPIMWYCVMDLQYEKRPKEVGQDQIVKVDTTFYGMGKSMS